MINKKERRLFDTFLVHILYRKRCIQVYVNRYYNASYFVDFDQARVIS